MENCFYSVQNIETGVWPSERKYVAFDLEISRIIPEGQDDLMRFRPLGVSCAATLSEDGQLRLWFERDESGKILEQISPDGINRLVDHLSSLAAEGSRIVTWNGLGFDFDILYEESGWNEECRRLAEAHTDMMFHLFCEKGFALGLDKAAHGMGLAGKAPDMDGSQAPLYWARGQHQRVLDYLTQDVLTTLQLSAAGDARRSLNWISGSGNRQNLALPRGWLRVEDAIRCPLPDTSWMRSPWTRSKFSGWLSR